MFRLLTWAFGGKSTGDTSDLDALHEKIRRMEELLQERNDPNEKAELDKQKREQETAEPTNCFQKTGRVTDIGRDHFVIDGLYFVPKAKLRNCASSESVEVNTRITFLAYRRVDLESGESAVKVVKILSIVDELWTDGGLAAAPAAEEHTWQDTTPAPAAPMANATVYFNGNQRREPGKVIEKDQGVLIVETDAGEPISVDMDKTRISFVPVLGDYVTLDCLVQVDHEFVDFKGEVLEVVAIEPTRTVSGVGKITDTLAEGGEIATRSGKFVYQSDCLADNYRPSIGDTVTYQAIENANVQMRCLSVKLAVAAPATKATPVQAQSGQANGREPAHRSSPRSNDHRGPRSETNGPQPWDDKEGIRIVGDFEIALRNSQDTAVRTVTVKNESKASHKILSVDAMWDAKDRQVTLTSPPPYSKIILLPGETAEYVFQITPGAFFGRSAEGWVWTFGGNFKISRKFLINIGDTVPEAAQTGGAAGDGTPSRRPHNTKQMFLQQKLAALNMRREEKSARVINGQQITKRPNFIAFKIPMYSVPSGLENVVLTANSSAELDEALANPPFCLDQPLSARNYARLFDHYIFLEEINQSIETRKHDIDRGHFTREDAFLALHVQGISEVRPSVMVGDSLYATAPWSHEGDHDVPVYQGCIHKVLQNRVLLKFDASFQARYNGESYQIRFSYGRGIYRKQHHAIERMKAVMGLDYLFPTTVVPREASLNVRLNDSDELVLLEADGGEEKERSLPWYNRTLNHYQKVAIANVLRGEARPLPYVIFGPPGTGKTITTIELIHQLAMNSPDCRLIVATPSNSAAYLITERLASAGLLKAGDFIRLVSMNQVERESIPEHLAAYCATVDVCEERNSAGEVLTTESGLRMKFQAKHIGRHRVTISTCSCIGLLMQMRFPRDHFTHVIIDEAGQSLEPDTLIPMTQINRTVGSVTLVGDPKQLGPVVLCRQAAGRGYQTSLLERLLCTAPPYIVDRERFADSHGYDPRLVTKLCVNYRSIPSVLALYNDIFYDSQLLPEQRTNGPSDTALLTALHEILGVERPTADYGFFFCGIDGTNKQAPDSPSWFNPAEACMVHKIVEKLYRRGYQPADIGVITPYMMQAKTIRRIFDVASLDAPKVGSVEEFQGQERKVIVVSTVRSSRSILPQDKCGLLGFVAAPKRVNVAISRAKVALVVVANPKLLGVDPVWMQVLQRAVNNETYVGFRLAPSVLSAAKTGTPLKAESHAGRA